MNGFLGHLCRPPEDSEMNEVTLPSKQTGLTTAPGPPPRNHRTTVLTCTRSDSTDYRPVRGGPNS